MGRCQEDSINLGFKDIKSEFLIYFRGPQNFKGLKNRIGR